MTPTQIHHDEHATLWHGDCIETMRLMPDASVDAVVTDPPYALDFMGHEWDRMTPGEFQHWCEKWASQALRVLKPGGHLLAFGGTRTFHRLAAGIEDAGFQIRDSIAWLYGSGFPKSLDVSKAIDKMRDDTADIRVICRWLRARIVESGHTTKTIAEYFGFNRRMVEHWAALDTDSQPTLPKLDQWDALRSLLHFDDSQDAEVYRLNLRKGEPGDAWSEREVLGEHTKKLPGFAGKRFTSRDTFVRGEGSIDAEAWQGWGTALKPAFEPVVVARKPLIGTVAANVLAHGTGALNIDASRIPGEVPKTGQGVSQNQGLIYQAGINKPGVTEFVSNDGARFPANVILDESQAEALDAMAPSTGGSGKASGPSLTGPTDAGVAFGARLGLQGEPAFYGDTGGASRFFYTAKAPQHERPKDAEGVGHPTVKPVSLMRWLVKLVTPPGGTVLEPFAGSGTTIEAALTEGFHVIAIEREAKYIPLCEARLARPMQGELF